MHDHLGHLNLVADKAIFADSWKEGGQKPSKNKKYSQTLWKGGSQPRLFEYYCLFVIFLNVFLFFWFSTVFVVFRRPVCNCFAHQLSFGLFR